MALPDVDGVNSLVRRIAATSLPGRSGVSTGTIAAATWRGVLEALVRERLTGLAVAASEQSWLRLSDRQLEELLERHRAAMLWTLRVEQTLLLIYRDLDSRGLSPVVLKGSALAHSFYPDPSWRAFRDLDLLVPVREWKATCSALEALGMRRRLPEPRRGFDERFGKAAVFTGSAGVQVDVHRSLADGPFGQWMHPDELFGRTTPFELAGTSLRRLDDAASLLHACVHASLGWTPPELLPLRDVAQIATVGDVDWGILEDVVTRWRLTAVIGHAFETTLRMFGDVLPSRAKQMMKLDAGPQEIRALQAYTSGRRWRGATVWSTLRAIRGARAKAAYVGALVFPNREFLKARMENGRSVSYLRRWAVPVRWIRGLGRRT